MHPYIDFCGETASITQQPFTIGRDADLVLDDNRHLHRQFLSIAQQQGVWLLANVGGQLTATVSDAGGRLEAFLAPGAVLPLVFEHTVVRFTAGPTNEALDELAPDRVFIAGRQEPGSKRTRRRLRRYRTGAEGRISHGTEPGP